MRDRPYDEEGEGVESDRGQAQPEARALKRRKRPRWRSKWFKARFVATTRSQPLGFTLPLKSS